MKYLILALCVFCYSTATIAQNKLVIRTSDGNGYDSHTWKTYDTMNFGTSPIIAVRAWTQSGDPQLSRAYFYFDLDSLPSKATISKAEFILTSDRYDGRTQNAMNPDSIVTERITSSWTESGINWSNAPTVTNVGRVAIMQNTDSFPVYTFNVTDIVKYWQANPSANYGMRVMLKNEAPYTIFYVGSKQNEVPGNRPRLEITYSTVGIEDEIAKDFKLNIYPNPFSDEVSVAYTLVKPASVNMSIYDLSGRIISEESAYMQAGNHTKRLSDQKLAPGTYILNLQIDDQSIQKQIFKLK